MAPRAWLRNALLAFVAGSVLIVQAHAQQRVPVGTDPVRAAWKFDSGDLTPHPGVRFGVLGNGMKYALMRNAAPAGGLSVRLRIGAGSTAETARELGSMHLIEHLIFHGTEKIPEGALPLMLAQQGLRRWTDFSAFTSYDETVYRLDLAKADGGARETALMVMREIADRLVFTRRAVEGAKDKVVEEIGARDTVADRVATAQNAFFMPGTAIARGPVAATTADVRRARGAALRRLYERTYEPGRATLVVVGDFDPAIVEAEIGKSFSDWRALAQSQAVAIPAIRRDRGTEALLFVDRAAPTAVTIAAVQPFGGADAGARRDGLFLEHLGFEMLTRRLAGKAGARFAGGSAVIYDHFSTARLALIEVVAKDRDWRSALQVGAGELRRVLDHGFSQAELDAQIAASRGRPAVDAAAQTSSMLADAIVDAVSRGIVYTEPAGPAANDAYFAAVELAKVNAAFRSVWASRSRLIFVSHDRAIPSGETAIALAWEQSQRAGY